MRGRDQSKRRAHTSTPQGICSCTSAGICSNQINDGRSSSASDSIIINSLLAERVHNAAKGTAAGAAVGWHSSAGTGDRGWRGEARARGLSG